LFLVLVEHFRCTWPLSFIQCPLQATLLATTVNIPYGLGSEQLLWKWEGFPYFHFRSESEQAQLKSPAWAA
jgi:hypothetical protein